MAVSGKTCTDMSVAQLKQKLQKLGLSTAGKKNTLLRRFEESQQRKCERCTSLEARVAELEAIIKALRPASTEDCAPVQVSKAAPKIVRRQEDQVVSTATTVPKKKKIVLLMSSHGRGCSELLKEEMGHGFDVCGIVKPGAPLSEVIKDAPALTKDADAVVVVGGTNDVSQQGFVDWSQLLSVLPKMKAKKIFVSPVPDRFDDAAARRRTDIENRRLIDMDFKNFSNESLKTSYQVVESIENLNIALADERDGDTNSTILDDETTCSCSRMVKYGAPTQDLSTCSRESAARGYHQRVLSFSFYGEINNQKRSYFQGIEKNAALAADLYPGWMMRVYHDMDPNSPEICSLYCQYPYLDFCNARYIPGLGNIMNRQRNAWRFLPMCDPMVDIFVSRDLDSLISLREKAAVDQWLQSNLTFHVMRDHKYHGKTVMAGMWGARPENDREKFRRLCLEMMTEDNGEKGKDQYMLHKYLWGVAKDDVLQHDSYTCYQHRSHGHMKGWPTKRLQTPYNFVGARIDVDKEPIEFECPLECRPEEHKDWTTC